MDQNNSIVQYQPKGLLPRVTNSIEITNKILAKPEEKLIPYRKKDKWGFCTPEKKIVIDFVYDFASRFKNGFSIVEQNGVKFKINKRGELRNNVEAFLSQGAKTVHNGAWITTKPIMEEVTNFFEGLACQVLNSKMGFISESGEVIIPHIFDPELFFNYETYSEQHKFSEGLVCVQRKKQWGFINREGKTVINFEFDLAGSFIEGIAPVVKNKKCGFINKKGDVIFPFIIDKGFGFGDDYWSHFDLPAFNSDLWSVNIRGKWGCIDSNGEVVVPFIYDYVRVANNFVAVKKESKWGYLDKKGEIAVPLIYDACGSFGEGLANVRHSEKYGYIDVFGKEKIPFLYDWAWSFHEGYAWVKKNDKYGFINTDGNVAIPIMYGGVENFEEGVALVREKLNGKELGYIDKTGSEYWED